MPGAEGVEIRIVTAGEAAQVLAADVFDGPALAAAVARFLGAPAAPDPRTVLVFAWLGDRVAGFASGTVLDHPDKPRQMFLQELGVNDWAQRRGIARALIAALRAEGRARGCTQTWVLTEADNAAALATYRAVGGAETTGVVMFDWEEDGTHP